MKLKFTLILIIFISDLLPYGYSNIQEEFFSTYPYVSSAEKFFKTYSDKLKVENFLEKFKKLDQNTRQNILKIINEADLYNKKPNESVLKAIDTLYNSLLTFSGIAEKALSVILDFDSSLADYGFLGIGGLK